MHSSSWAKEQPDHHGSAHRFPKGARFKGPFGGYLKALNNCKAGKEESTKQAAAAENPTDSERNKAKQD